MVNSDAASILFNYLSKGWINIEGVGGIEKMLEACIEGLLDAAAKTASQSDLDTDRVTAMLNQKMRERGVRPAE